MAAREGGSWSRKVKAMEEEAEEVKREAMKARRNWDEEAMYQADREELMGGAAERRGGVNSMADLVDEGRSLDNSARMLGDAISQGSASLNSLLNQRDRMKGVRTAMLNIAATLGVSANTLRVIERRDAADRIIVFGGMLVVIVIIWVLYR